MKSFLSIVILASALVTLTQCKPNAFKQTPIPLTEETATDEINKTVFPTTSQENYKTEIPTEVLTATIIPTQVITTAEPTSKLGLIDYPIGEAQVTNYQLGEDFIRGCFSTKLWHHNQEQTMPRIQYGCDKQNDSWKFDDWFLFTEKSDNGFGIKIINPLPTEQKEYVYRRIHTLSFNDHVNKYNIDFDLKFDALTTSLPDDYPQFYFGIGNGYQDTNGAFIRFFGSKANDKLFIKYNDIDHTKSEYIKINLNYGQIYHVTIAVDGPNFYVKIGENDQIPLHIAENNNSFSIGWKYPPFTSSEVYVENLKSYVFDNTK